jgi:hypothetical protein
MFNFLEANKLYFEQFYGGRKAHRKELERDYYGFPFGHDYWHDKFVEVEIPISLVNIRLRAEELVDQYADSINEGDKLPPIWVSIGRKLKNGDIILFWNRKIKTLDGFHRTAAHKKLGIKMIKAIMPLSHYKLFNTLEVRGNELYSKN